MRRNYSRRQAGFTLVEALVVLSIIALIAVISMTAFDGSRSKAQTLLAVMGQTAQASQQFRTDTGVYPSVPAALFDSALATGANTFGSACGAGTRSVVSSWTRPYMSKQKLNNNNIVLDKVGAGVEIDVTCARNATTGFNLYYISAVNVPSDIVTNAIRECNNDTGADIAISAANLTTNKCAGSAAGGTFAMVFDQTR